MSNLKYKSVCILQSNINFNVNSFVIIIIHLILKLTF